MGVRPVWSEGPTLGLILCCGHLEVLNNCEHGAPHFNFALVLPLSTEINECNVNSPLQFSVHHSR